MEPLSIQEDFSSVLIYQGQGFTVHENQDPEFEDAWFTIVVNENNGIAVRNALSFFGIDAIKILDMDVQDQHIFIDVAYA